jgi:hypothetical protein
VISVAINLTNYTVIANQSRKLAAFGKLVPFLF